MIKEKKGLEFERYFTQEGKAAEDYFKWNKRDIQIKNKEGQIIYDGKELEFPSEWEDREIGRAHV